MHLVYVTLQLYVSSVFIQGLNVFDCLNSDSWKTLENRHIYEKLELLKDNKCEMTA